jgi:hypothetical protein
MIVVLAKEGQDGMPSPAVLAVKRVSGEEKKCLVDW